MLLGVLGSVGKLLHVLGVLSMLLGVLLSMLLLLLLWRMLRLVLNMLLNMLLRELLLELLWVRLCVLGSMLNRMLGRVLRVSLSLNLHTRRVALSTPRRLRRYLGRGWLLRLWRRLRLLSVRQGRLNWRCSMVCRVRSSVLWLLMMLLGGCLRLTTVSKVHGIGFALPHIGLLLLLLLLLLLGIVSRRCWMVEIRDAGVVGGARVLLVLGLRRRDNPVLHGLEMRQILVSKRVVC